MPAVNRTTNCGTFVLEGVREFSRNRCRIFLRSVAQVCAGLAVYELHRSWRMPGIILFSDARSVRRNTPTKGEQFAAYIRERQLGTVTEGPWTINPNTQHQIKFFIWNTDEQAIQRLIQ